MNIEESRKFIEDKCPHLDNGRQEIGFYEMCCLMEDYHQHKLKSDLLNPVIGCPTCNNDGRQIRYDIGTYPCATCGGKGFR